MLRFIFLSCSLNKSKAGKLSFHSTQQQQRMAKTSRVIGIDDTFISAKPWLPSEPCFSFPTEPSISILTVQQNVLPNPRPPDSRGVGQSHRDVLPQVPMPSPPGTPKASSSLLSTARLLSCGTFKEQTAPCERHRHHGIAPLCCSWNFQIVKMLLLHIPPLRTGRKNALSFSMAIVSEDLARDIFERIAEQS